MSHMLKNVSIRLVEEPPLLSEIKITKPEEAIKLVGENIKNCAREVVCIINLDTRKRPLNMSVVSMGTLNASLVDPKEIYKTALLSNADSIIILHNHPSGNLGPSIEDIKTTDRLIQCGKLMDIALMDHVIVGNTRTPGFYSLREKGYFDNNKRSQTVEVVIKEELLNFDLPTVAETSKIEEMFIIRTKKDVQRYLEQVKNCEVSATDYVNSVWFRNLAGYECIDDDVIGIIGTTKEELANYIWNHRKLINSALRGESSYAVEKKNIEVINRKGRAR